MVTLGCAAEDLPPFGEALMVVDTDAALSLVSRLRVDVYSEDGRWLRSRDLLTSDERDWPVSFSVQASVEEERRSLVRLRAYPTGRVRDYRGERYREKPTWEPPVPPTSVEEMCDAPVVLRPGDARWVRVGPDGSLESPSWCGLEGGPVDVVPPTHANALALEIDEAATYRITLAGIRPESGGASVEIAPGPMVPVQMHLQETCGMPEPVDPLAGPQALPACPEGALEAQWPLDPPGPYASSGAIERSLAPGRYFVLVGALGLAPVEIAIGVTKLEEWDDFVSRVPELLNPTREAEVGEPLPLDSGPVPLSEPDPLTTIDRLVLLDLEPGQVSSARVTLRAACFGAMARLRDDWPNQPPRIDEALTCTHVEDQLVALEPYPLSSDLSVPTASEHLHASLDPEECDGADTEACVCVPGGVLLLGDPDLLGNGEYGVDPERVALMSRFWIDRREVTVGDYRRALAAGFASVDPPAPRLSSTGFVDPSVVGHPELGCTWRPGAAGADDGLPLNCVSWSEARAYCQFMGGDLPTAAQWEYVATAAGRAEETLFPWGNDVPKCSPDACVGAEGPCHAIHADRLGSCEGNEAPMGPAFVESYADADHGDVSVPLNADPASVVFGLAGGVSELTLDALYPYDSDCWLAADLIDPECSDRDAVFRELRGGSWARPLAEAAGTSRSAALTAHNRNEPPGWPPGPAVFNFSQGLRCVYGEAP
jgi:formylglycine-generating enzyme required for sulfatase activity